MKILLKCNREVISKMTSSTEYKKMLCTGLKKVPKIYSLFINLIIKQIW